MPISVGT
jgi:hydroxymethylglutaryl-CoA reductase